jgi:hypothetical protein
MSTVCGRTQLADHQRGGGVPAVHRGGDPKQIIPAGSHQLVVEPAREQRSGVRVAALELRPRPWPTQGDLAQIPDPWGELSADQVEQREVRQRRTVGIGRVLQNRWVGVTQDPVEDDRAFRGVRGNDFGVQGGVLIGHRGVGADALASGEVPRQVPGGDRLALDREPLPVRGCQGPGAEGAGHR